MGPGYLGSLVEYLEDQYGNVVPLGPSGDAYLDPVEPELVGCIDLRPWLHNSNAPLSIAANILFAPEQFVESLQRPRFLSSKGPLTLHGAELMATGLLVPCDRRRGIRGFGRFFTVEKKKDDKGSSVLRTIVDCKDANDAFMRPPPTHLPNVKEILNTFKDAEVIRTLDLRHMFHQVRISNELRSWFTLCVGSRSMQWNALPMGFKWSCFVAQAISSFCAAGSVALQWAEIPRVLRCGRVDVIVFYDNIIAGGTRRDVEAYWPSLLSNIRALGGRIKEQFRSADGLPVDVLGLALLPGKPSLAWHLLDKFVDKVRSVGTWWTLKEMPIKNAARLLGWIVWGRYALQKALHDLVPFFRFLAAEVGRDGWRGKTNPLTWRALEPKVLDICAAGWQSFRRTVSEVVCFTDAHLTGYGWVGGNPLVVHSRRFTREFQPRDMFFLEAVAAKWCVRAMAQPDRKIFLFTDNKALTFAVQKGITACPRTAVVLEEMQRMLDEVGCQVAPIWIPTALNPADELSRGGQLDRNKLVAAVEWAHGTRDMPSRWGPELGWVVG